MSDLKPTSWERLLRNDDYRGLWDHEKMAQKRRVMERVLRETDAGDPESNAKINHARGVLDGIEYVERFAEARLAERKAEDKQDPDEGPQWVRRFRSLRAG